MIKKVKNTENEFYDNIKEIQLVINNNNNFLFYFSYDPDAIGASIAISLFLKTKKKDCYIYLPELIDPNLNFLIKILSYNSIKVIKNSNKLYQIINKKTPVIITCDTPTHYLLPDFNNFNALMNKLNLKETIEIDHHFGGDSEQVFENSLTLFKEANSTCEIVATFFEIIGKDENGNLDLEIVFPRNVVISLLVGICFDTQMGKYITNSRIYNKWIDFLSNRLEWLTWGSPKNMNNANKIFEAINKMNSNRKRVIKKLIKSTLIINKVGLLIIPKHDKYKSLCENNDPSCIFVKIIPDITNKTTEYSGAIGIVVFFDTILNIFYIKIRRAQKFKKYDLRDIQHFLKNIFKTNYLGGGGHEGATSYRIANIDRDEFIDKIKKFHKKLSSTVEKLLYTNKNN